MKMDKVVRKLRPSDYWSIGEHESWFADMASQGLHLKKMGIHFAHFEKDEPKKMKYRIEVSMKKRMRPEQTEMYAESGWDYVTGYQFFHVFSSPVERNAPEIHTDPAEQSYTLEALDKKLAFNAGMVVVALLIMIAMVSAVWFLDGTPIRTLVEGIAIQQTILSIFIGYQAYTSLRAALSIRALRNDLIEGKPIDHHAPWKKHQRLHSTITFLFTLFLGLTAIMPFVQILNHKTITLPEESTNLPIVRLADIEQNPALVREKYFIDDIDWANRYTSKWSPFAPVQYDTDESGVVPGEVWKGLSGEYSPSISTNYYQLTIPAMADNLVFDLIDWYRHENPVEDYVETKHPDFDLLIVREDEYMKEVFASRGREVIFVRYNGYANVDLVLDSIVEKLEHTSHK